MVLRAYFAFTLLIPASRFLLAALSADVSPDLKAASLQETPHLYIQPGFLVGMDGDLPGDSDVINTFTDVTA